MARKKQWNWQEGLVGTARRRDEPFPTLTEIEVLHIAKVLQAYGFNFVHAARALGISRATLYRKMHREMRGVKDMPVIKKKRSKTRTARAPKQPAKATRMPRGAKAVKTA